MSEKELKAKYKGPTMFFYVHIFKEVSAFFLLVGGLITLAIFFPPEMGSKADPFVTPQHIKPEWYFLAGYQLLIIADKLSFLGTWAPKMIGVLSQGVVVFAMLILPIIDRNPEREPSKRKGMIAIGILFIISFLGLTAWGHFS